MTILVLLFRLIIDATLIKGFFCSCPLFS